MKEYKSVIICSQDDQDDQDDNGDDLQRSGGIREALAPEELKLKPPSLYRHYHPGHHRCKLLLTCTLSLLY